MMKLTETSLSLLRLMSDGQYHSGEQLGEALGVSRAAVWKTIGGLNDLGFSVQRLRGKGYCISGGVALLDASAIRQVMRPEVVNLIQEFDILMQTSSTNSHILERIKEAPELTGQCVCLAEMQSAGRGRRGRQWQSGFGRNLALTISQSFENGIAAMEGLSLAIGTGVVDALETLGISGAQLKWPNDVLVDGKKLAGILIEITGDVSGRCHAVIGLGLNVQLSAEAMALVDQPWCDLAGLSASPPARNIIAGVIIDRLVAIAHHFERDGFEHYRERWESLSAHMGERVVITTSSCEVEGLMSGVDGSGAVLLDVNGKCQSFVGGEVSLRSRL